MDAVTRISPDFIELAYEFPAELRPPDSEDYFKLPLVVAREMGFSPAVYSMRTPTNPRADDEFDGFRVRRFGNPISLYLAAARTAPRLAHGHSFGWIPSTLGPTLLPRYIFTPHVYRLDSYNRMLVNLAAKSISRSTAVIALTEWERQMLSRYMDIERIRVIPCGIDVQFFGTPDPTGVAAFRERYAKCKLVLAVSNIVRRKNLTTLLRAFRTVRRRLPQTKLLIAGGAPSVVLGAWRPSTYPDTWVRTLLSEVQVLGLQGDVVFLGHQTAEQLRTLYQAADLLASTSTIEGQFLSAGEAAAAALPMALPDLEPLREIYSDAALFHPPLDADSVAEGILRILTEESLARKLGAAGRRSIQLYDISMTKTKLKRLYEECLC